MPAFEFAPHGEFSVRIDGRILDLHTRGPWNRELIEQFSKNVLTMVAQLEGAPWGVLATVSGEGMHTPDSYAAMIEGIRWQRARGRCATAVVFDQVFAANTARRILERMYAEAGEPVRFFDASEPARVWLETQITRISN